MYTSNNVPRRHGHYEKLGKPVGNARLVWCKRRNLYVKAKKHCEHCERPCGYAEPVKTPA